MEGFFEDYYCKHKSGEPAIKRGAIVWAPCSYLLEKFTRLKPDHYNPAQQRTDIYSPQPMEPDDLFRNVDGVFHHLPVAEHGLQQDEEFAAVRYKLRKAIVFSQAIEAQGFSSKDLERLRIWFLQSFVILPMYTLEDRFGRPKFSTGFIARAKGFAFPQFYPLPKSTAHGIRECVVRYDRIQVAQRQFLQPTDTELTEEGMHYVEDWLRYYLCGHLEDKSVVAYYREQMLPEVEKAYALKR